MVNVRLEMILQKGYRNAIECRKLMKDLAMDGNQIREAIMQARKRGFPVISRSGKVYIAESGKEFEMMFEAELRDNLKDKAIEHR